MVNRKAFLSPDFGVLFLPQNIRRVSMSPDVALLLLTVATAFVFISAQSTCRNTVHCSCSSTGEKFTVCAGQNTTLADPCTQWPGCKSCEDATCYTAGPSESEKLVYCRDPGRVVNGNRIPVAAPNQQGFSQGSIIEYYCNQGFTLQGNESTFCLASGSWSSVVPKCEVLVSGGEEEFCLSPGSIENGKITYYPSRNSQRGLEVSLDDTYPPNSRLVFSCNEGYRRQGASDMTCQNGDWSSEEPPTCALDRNIMYCETQGFLMNGKVEYFPPDTYPKPITERDSEYPEGTRALYTCAVGFDLQGSANVSCMVTSRWSSVPPVCSRECGRSFASADSKVYKGTRTVAGEWPWVVTIREDSESDISCGGAVINSRTVITAAHCLPDPSKSYILYFGKIRKLDKDDDAKVMKRTSTRIIIHPYYSAQTMEADLALIHFSNPIQFSDRIHPICLPDTASAYQHIRNGSTGFVAGFGEDDSGLTPDNLMRAELPVQENEVCQKYFQDKGIRMNMTHSMFCAGYPNAEQATSKPLCKGDSGSAFVFRNVNTNLYTLEGLVSASTNGRCAEFGKYTIFTRVHKYGTWILRNLAM